MKLSRNWLLALVGIVPLAILPTLWRLKPLWSVGRQGLAILGLSVAAYVLSAGILSHAARRGREVTPWQVLAVGSACLLPVVLAVVAASNQLWHVGIFSAVLLTLGLLWLSFGIQRWYGIRLILLSAFAIAAVTAEVLVVGGLLGTRKPGVQHRLLDSQLYELAMTAYQYVVPEPVTQQGGISRFGDGYVLVTGDGDAYFFERPATGGNLDMKRLPIKAPLNSADFEAAMAGLPVVTKWFRVADVLAQATPRGIRLYVSHHYWKIDARCFVMRVSVVEGTKSQYLDGSLHWRTLYETEPCLRVVDDGRPPHFVGLENGGRMALLGDEVLLLAVGDHAIDGLRTGSAVAQQAESSYGKIIRIDLHDGSKRVLSLGHRNPQGLAVDSAGQIWSTEHGPQGGDELNLITEGGNYGWPYASYGVDYGTRTWPLTPVPGSHDGPDYIQPYYSWIPSIAASNLLPIASPLFEYWHGDLVVGALKDRSLWRVRIRDERVVALERIALGDERVRDLVEGHRGELVLWTDTESIIFIEPAQQSSASDVRQLYRICTACHIAPNGTESAIGPDLMGVVGRRVGAVDGFDYSASMQASGGVWTRERLDAFLENPALVIPGTTMTFAGIKEPAARRALIEFLADPNSDLNPVTEDHEY